MHFQFQFLMKFHFHSKLQLEMLVQELEKSQVSSFPRNTSKKSVFSSNLSKPFFHIDLNFLVGFAGNK